MQIGNRRQAASGAGSFGCVPRVGRRCSIGWTLAECERRGGRRLDARVARRGRLPVGRRAHHRARTGWWSQTPLLKRPRSGCRLPRQLATATQRPTLAPRREQKCKASARQVAQPARSLSTAPTIGSYHPRRRRRLLRPPELDVDAFSIATKIAPTSLNTPPIRISHGDSAASRRCFCCARFARR